MMVPSTHGESQQLRQLKIASLVEAATLLALVGVAVPLKHLGGWPLGVRIAGPIHGLTFFTYTWLVLQSFGAGLWSRNQALRLLLVAFVPFAGFLTARLVERRAKQICREEPAV